MFAVLLDRDGVINEEVNFLRSIDDLTFLPGSIEALERLSTTFSSEACKIIVTTNQSMIARGMITEDAFQQLTAEYLVALRRASNGNVRIDDYLYCPHHPTEGVGAYRIDCECRKPKTGMFLEAQRRFGFELADSFMIGDRATDVLAGQAASCFSIMVHTGYGGDDGSGVESHPDLWCRDLAEAVEVIINRVRA